MAYRRFRDREGRRWEVVDRSSREWELRPVEGNPDEARRVRPPGYEKDPFELSERELQRILDRHAPRGSSEKKSPFED